jgi:hypothetical protein
MRGRGDERAPRTQRLKRLLLAGMVGGALATGVPGPATAAGTDGPDFELPFPCGDTWTGTSRYNHSPSSLSVDFNKANDLGAPTVAAAPGVITSAVNLGDRSYGRYIVVDHGGGWTTLYAHLSAFWSTTGQAVDQGTVLGLVGTSGGSTGPHLHFEERYNKVDQRAYFHRTVFTMGSTMPSANCGDTPVIGDWDGNGTSNIGVFRRSSPPLFYLKRPGRAPLSIGYGRPTDQPVSGDWDGDGGIDIGVRRASSMSFLLRNKDGSSTSVPLGRLSDFGLTGDWNGDRKTDLGVWHPNTRLFTLRAADGSTKTLTFGALGDRPVTGDWNGDKKTDLGVYSASTSTFTLRTVSRTGVVSTQKVVWGTPTSLPVAGDWNEDGLGDVGVWNPATATFSLRLTPSIAGRAPGVRSPLWGVPRG